MNIPVKKAPYAHAPGRCRENVNRQPYIAFACSYTEHPSAKGVCYEAFIVIINFYS